MRHKIVSMVLPELYKSKKKIKFFFAKATLVTKLIPSKAQKQEQSQRKTISKLEESILNFSLTPLATTQSPLGAPTNLALRKISDVTHNRCRLPTNLTRRGLQRRDSFWTYQYYYNTPEQNNSHSHAVAVKIIFIFGTWKNRNWPGLCSSMWKHFLLEVLQ